MKTSEEILSKATGIQAYNPTFRERSTRTVANLLRDKFGMDNYKAVELAQGIFGNPNAESILDQLGAATFSPAEAVFGGQEGAREFKRADDLVGKGIGAATVGLSALEAFPATALMAKGIKRMFPKGAAAESPSTQILKELPEEDVQNLSFLIHEKQAAGIPTESLGSVEKALDLSKNTSTKTPLYRGLYGEEIKYLGDVKKGDFIDFDRYKSFSEKPDIAKGFGGTNVLLKANSSKGGFNYGDFVQESMKDYKKKSPADYDMEDGDFIFDSAKEEAEWIFGRNKGFKITDVKKEGDFTVIEGDIEQAVDVGRRKVTQGIAALPIAATGIAKVIGDLPMGAVAKVAKVAPKVTGSKLLDSLPFVKDELAPIIEGVLSNKTKINFLSSYKPVPPTPGNIPPPRPSLKVKEITPEDRLFQGLYQLNELRDRIKDFSKLENAKTLSDIGDTRIRDYDVIGEESPSLGITDNILNDFAEKYPDMSIDDAIKMVGKDGYDMFVKSFKSGELDNSDFLKYLVDYQTGPGDPGSVAKSKKLIEKVIKDNPDGTIDTVVYDIFGSDSIYDFMDADHDTAFSIGEEFFMPDEKARRAFKEGDMSQADFEKYIADKKDAGEEIKMYRSSN